jgi:hypothetical protein
VSSATFFVCPIQTIGQDRDSSTCYSLGYKYSPSILQQNLHISAFRIQAAHPYKVSDLLFLGQKTAAYFAAILAAIIPAFTTMTSAPQR